MGFFLTLLLFAATFVLSELLRPKLEQEQAKPRGLGDFNFPTATEARVVPLVWGTVRIDGPNVIWYGDLRQDAITEEVKTGLFSSDTITKGFEYRVGIQFGICRGPIDAVTGIWIGGTRVFTGSVGAGGTITINEPELFGGNDNGAGGVTGVLEVFTGTTTQTASSYLNNVSIDGGTVNAGGTGYAVGDVVTVSGGTFTTAATFRVSAETGGVVDTVELIEPGIYSVLPATPAATTGGSGTGLTIDLTFGTRFQDEQGNTPAYRGTAYLVPQSDPIYVGNSTSIKPWSFEVERIPNGLSLGTPTVNGDDANPMNVVYEILTDTDWGLGVPAADVDTSNFTTAATTLATEGNGFSAVLDRQIEAVDLLRDLERQIDGVVFFNQVTGQFQVNLARFDYDVDTVPQVDSTSLLEIANFARGAWEDTTNTVRVQFNQRDDDYKETFAGAWDLANAALQDDVNVSVTETYFGVKDKTLANNIAWRDLRTVSFPLAKAKLVVDRSLHAVQPGQVIAFTDSDLGFTKLAMRVSRVDLGELAAGRITLDVVQDVFSFQQPGFDDPNNTGWTPPQDSLLPFIASQQLAFEAPRALVLRDPAFDGVESDRVWTGGRRRRNESSFRIRERHAAGTPSGAFADAGDVFQFFLIGQLKSALARGTAIPTTTVTLTASPDSKEDLEAAFTDNPTLSDLGSNLFNMVLVGNEFMLVESAAINAADVDLSNVYRGVMGTAQEAHLAGALVYLVSVGGGLSNVAFTPGDNVDIKLLPRSISAIVAEADATTIQLTMNDRVRSPYPPSQVSIGGTFYGSTVSLEQTGSGGEDFGFVVDFVRRSFRTIDEIEALSNDAATLFSDYPALNSTTHEMEVRNDPAGANTLLFTTTGIPGTTTTALRILILKATGGVLPTTLGVVLRSRHTLGTNQYTSFDDLLHSFSVTTALTGDFNFGALDNGDISNVYTVDAAGVHNFTLSSAFTAGDVEFRVNGGAFSQLIAAGMTTGATGSLSVSDTLEIRHLSTDTLVDKFITMAAPGAGTDGYAVLFT